MKKVVIGPFFSLLGILILYAQTLFIREKRLRSSRDHCGKHV